MSNFQLEIVRLVLFLFLWGYLWRVAGREDVRQDPQWSYIFLGFGLIFLGLVVSLTEDFPPLNRFLVIGSTPYSSYLKNAIVFPLGFISVIIGIGRLLPKLGALRNAETALKESHRSLAEKVLDRTTELESINRRLLREISERKEAEESLRKSEERFRLHFQNVNDVIFSYDTEFTMLDVSEAVERVLGYKPQELIGRRIYDLNIIVPEDSKRSMDDARQVLAGKRIASSAYTFITKDGTRRFGDVSGAPIRQEGKIVGVVSVARDITQRRETERALWESEQKYRSIIENIREGYYEVDLAGDMVFCNESMARILGYAKEELLGMNNRQYMTEPVGKYVYRTFNDVFTTGKPAEVSGWELIEKDGTTRYVEASISLISDSTGNATGFRGIVRDVTERKQAEQALRKAHDELEERVAARTRELQIINKELEREIEERKQAEYRYRTLVELAPVPIHIQCDGKIVFANSTAAKAMGADSRDDLIGRSQMDFLDPDNWALAESRAKKMIEEWRPAPVVEMKASRLDGSPVWMELHSAPIAYEGQPSILVFTLDVTDRKQGEEQIRGSLREKEILLREIHHRVKNNLQLMSSMLELQASFSEDRPGVGMLQDAQNRIRAMAAAHETLYRSGDLGNITSRDYLSRLADDLYGAMGSGSGYVDLRLDIEDVPLKIDTAVNCGLILSELLSNCFKHAFPDARFGEVVVSFRLTGPGEIGLSVRDNGVGVPADLDLRNLSKFGLELVTMLVQEMQGAIDLHREGFTEFHIKFHIG